MISPRAIIKFLFGLFIGLSIAALTAFNVVLAWAATGPRSLDVLSPYIEQAFESPDHRYSVNIGETWLVWDGWRHPLDIRLRNVKITTKERHTHSTIPEISLGLDLLGVLGGHILPTSLTFTHPAISLFQDENRTISLGLEAPPDEAEENMEQVPFADIMAPLLVPDENSSLRKLYQVSVANADLTLSNKRKGVVLKASGTDFTIKRNRQGLQAFANARIAYDNYQSVLAAQFTQAKNSTVIEGEVTLNNLMPGVLAGLFSDNKLLAAMKFPLSGKASLLADMDGAVQKIGFALDGGRGTLNSNKLDGAVPVSGLHIEGQLGHDTTINSNTLEISELNADLDGMLLVAHGTVALLGDEPEVHGSVELKNVPTENVILFWPPGLAPASRDWVVHNVTGGTVSDAKANINIAMGDLAKPVLPKKDIDALITLENGKIRYLPEHPQVSAVNAKIHVDGVSLDAAIESGQYMKNTTLSEGTLLIEDLNIDNPYIKVSMSADSTASDVIHFIDLPPIKHAGHLNLKADEAQGKIKGHATLGFNFFAPRDAKGKAGELDVDYAVKAELSGVSQDGFMKKFDGKNLSGSLAIDNKALEFIGNGNINGASISEADVKYLFTPEGEFDTFIKASATAPVEVLPRFGYPAFEFLKGVVGVNVSLKEGKTMETSEATLDLTNATISVPAFHLQKPEKEPASLSLSAEKREGFATIPAFHFTGKNMEAKGSADVNKDMSGVSRVHMDRLVLGSTNLDQLTYERTDTGRIIDMRGTAVDLSPWFEKKDSKEASTFSFEHFPALQLKTDVARVVFGQGRELLAAKGTVDCDSNHCESANIAGTTMDGKPFNFRILRNPKGSRQLSLHAENAGLFLKSIDLFDAMEGGDLSITGDYTESAEGNALHGRVDINDHTVKNASVLAKMLSLASLTGIFDTLQGKGIHFARLSAPFTLSHDVITLDKAKTHGDALGLTAEGTITFPKVELNIQGTIVPSYSLNHVLGNVPLIGGVLTGGEGQGVFAARYDVTGTQDDPKVSVNPLSILTPGFLRGVFDIMDNSPPKEEGDSQ